jgi:alpha-beta hydrolase superfamily lysophospholipase
MPVTSYATRGTEPGLAFTSKMAAFANDALPGGIYCHGLGGLGWFDALGTAEPKLRSLARADFKFVAMDMGGSSTWGNAASTSKMPNAITQLAAIGGRTDRLFVLAQSMGALTALGSVLAGTLAAAKIAGMALMIPALDLVDLHDQNRGGNAAGIETALGVAGAYAGNVTIKALDPAQNPASFRGFPIRIWNGGADPIAVPATVTAFAAAVGANVVVKTNAAAVHDATAAAPVDEVLAFALSVV